MSEDMNWLISLWIAYQSTPAEAQAFQETAPTYLTTTTAAAHLGAARIAGAQYDVDPVLLLAIAHHESRYVVEVRSYESGGRVSCGVMTPRPQAYCKKEELTLLGGYLAGAEHLRTWMDVCHEVDGKRHDRADEVIQHCALWAYVGGLRFRSTCETHPRRAGCDAVGQFEDRARMIRRALRSTL